MRSTRPGLANSPHPAVRLTVGLLDRSQLSQDAEIRVLFVCLGNICRSPSAQGVFQALVCAHGLDGRIAVDSAGTGDWHVGKPPDARAAAAAAARGIAIDDLRARQVTAADFARHDYVIAMDAANRAELERRAGQAGMARAPIFLLGDFSERFAGQPVPDPYFGGDDGFDDVLDRIDDGARGLLAHVRTALA